MATKVEMRHLNGVVGGIPPGTIGFDTDTKLNPQRVANFVNAGYQFCLRYLSLGQQQVDFDLDIVEAESIINGGLGLMPVQHVRLPGWMPTKDLGTQDGANARANAFRCGFPPHVNVWLDLEGVGPGAKAADVILYANAWYDAVAAWGYLPGIYVGCDIPLTGEQWYNALKFRHYWKSLSDVPEPLPRGFMMIQTAGEPYYGVSIDRDVVQKDHIGNLPQWIKKED